MLHDLIAGDSVLMAFWQEPLRTIESEAHQQEEQTMCMQLRTFLTTTLFLGVIGLATGAWALNATDWQTPFNNEEKSDGQRDFGNGLAANTTQPTPATQLRPPAQDHFQEYQEKPHALGYRAFAIESESGKWGQGTIPSWPEIAIRQAIEDCRQRAARICEIYAVGDIVVHGLADWKVQVATMLYQVKRSATNDDFEAISTKDGGTAITALRRTVLHTGAKMGSTGAVVAMLDRGIDVNARSDAGVTALLYAASRARHEVVVLLLERGANVNSRNDVGRTALSIALLAKRFAQLRNYRMDDHDAVIRLLKDAGGTE